LPSRVQCFNGTCVPSRDGVACIYCGRTLQPAQDETPFGILLDPDDPNYWIYLMHDLEVIAEPVPPRPSAGLGFYGKRPNRKAS
jgi:hypothetical protein